MCHCTGQDGSTTNRVQPEARYTGNYTAHSPLKLDS